MDKKKILLAIEYNRQQLEHLIRALRESSDISVRRSIESQIDETQSKLLNLYGEVVDQEFRVLFGTGS